MHFWRLLSNLGLAPSQLALKFQVQKTVLLPASPPSACLSLPLRKSRIEPQATACLWCVCVDRLVSARPDEPLSDVLPGQVSLGPSRPLWPVCLVWGGPAVGQRANPSTRVAAASRLCAVSEPYAPAAPSIPLPRVSRGGNRNRLADRPRRNTRSLSLSLLSAYRVLSWKIAQTKTNFRRELARPCAAQSPRLHAIL